jgi:hypothetical protein
MEKKSPASNSKDIFRRVGSLCSRRLFLFSCALPLINTNRTFFKVDGPVTDLMLAPGADLNTARQLQEDTVASITAYTEGTSVVEYGAIGDGSTDDTTAFANAIASGAKDLYVPDGTYLIGSAGVNLNVANQRLTLAPGATIKGNVAQGAGVRAVLTVSASGVAVVGGTINASSLFDEAIYVAAGKTDSLIDGVQLQGGNSNGVLINDACSRTRVRRCKVTMMVGTAISARISSTDTSDIVITDNQIDFSSAAVTAHVMGVSLYSPSANVFPQANVSGNSIRLPAAQTWVNGYCIGLANVANAIVAENRCVGGYAGIHGVGCVDTVIGGNTINNPYSIGIFIYVATNSPISRLLISGNTVKIPTTCTNGIAVSQRTPSGKQDVGIIANTVVGGPYPNGTYRALINIVGLNGVTISANVLDGSAYANGRGHCIYSDTCNNVSISGGTIEGGSNAATGIVLEASNYVVVSGVTFSNLTVEGVSVVSQESGRTVDHIAVSGCIFDNVTHPYDTYVANGGILGPNCTITGCNKIVAINASSNGNAIRGDCLDAKNNVWNFVGSGAPESNVTAGIGSTYRDEAGGSGTTFYVKESGTGNTGWSEK